MKDRRCEVEVVLVANSVRLSQSMSMSQGGPIQEDFRQDVARFWRVRNTAP